MSAELEVNLKLLRKYKEDPDFPREKSRHESRLMEALGNAVYEPAIDFFFQCLDDENWFWREYSLKALGWYYEWSSGGPFAIKVRELLLNDPDLDIRKKAAFVTGLISNFPNADLINILKHEPDWDLRYSAFTALISLSKVGGRHQAWSDIGNKVYEPTWENFVKKKWKSEDTDRW